MRFLSALRTKINPKVPLVALALGLGLWAQQTTGPLTARSTTAASVPLTATNTALSPTADLFDMKNAQGTLAYFNSNGQMVLAPTPMVAPTGVGVTQTGSTGSTTYYYWVVTNFVLGNSALSTSVEITTSANTLSSSNYNTVSWTAVPGASTYDVLRTTSATAPTGSCGCAVATGVSGTSQNDESNTLSAYTVSTYAGTENWVLSNVPTGAGTSNLSLKFGSTEFDLGSGGVFTAPTLEVTHPAICPTCIEGTQFADQFHASGSNEQTTGSISASSFSLSLASARDFTNSEGIQVVHAGSAQSLSTPGAPTITVTGSGSTTCAYAVAALDGAGGETAVGTTASTSSSASSLDGITAYNSLAWTPVTNAKGYAIYGTCSGASPLPLIGLTAIPAYFQPFHASLAYTLNTLVQPTTPNGWVYKVTTAGTSGSSSPAWCTTSACTVTSGTVTFTAQSMTFADRGVAVGADGFYVSPQVASTAPSSALADSLITTISSGGGTTALTLSASATTAATSVTVLHDDTAAIQAAINAAATYNYTSGVWYLAASQPVVIPAGQYLISSAVTLPQYIWLRGSDQTILQQTTPTASVLNFSDVYSQGAENMTLVGGADQIVASNADVDTTVFALNQINFNSALDYAVLLRGDGTVDLHMSMQADLDHDTFTDDRRLIWDGADLANIRSAWVETYPDALVDASTAMGFVLEGALHVDKSAFIGPDAMYDQRWFDNYGQFYADGTRFSGEQIGGIPVVYNYAGYGTTPYWEGGAISITNSPYLATDGASPCHCVVDLITAVPNSITITGNHNLTAPDIVADASTFNVDTFLNGALSAGASQQFYVRVGGVDIPQSYTMVPSALLGFVSPGTFRVDTVQPTSGLWLSGQSIRNTTTVGGAGSGWTAYQSGQAAPAWQASHAYTVGEFVVASPDNAHIFECTTAGTTGASQPTWNTSGGGTTTDGGVTWTESGASAAFASNGLQRYADGSACFAANSLGTGCSDLGAGLNSADATKFFGGVQVGSPTGGSEGAGTINAQGVYSDGVQLLPSLSGTVSITANATALAAVTGTATITGATTSMACVASAAGTADADAFPATCYVSATNTVTVQVVTRVTDSSAPAITYNIRVIQ